MADVRKSLLEKTWFGFDLDDTLHEFRKVCRIATTEILRHLATEHQIPLEDLTDAWAKTIATDDWQCFTDGRASDEYRKERFAAVLENFSISPTPEVLYNYAAQYKTALEQSLELKPGALSLLAYLKSIGKKVVVISEGPHDAQQWTLEKLGIADFVDFLATSNKYGLTKNAGLFQQVLVDLKVEAKDVVFIGDNFERDVVQARKAGICAIHYSEKGSDEPLSVTNLGSLESVLRGDK